MTLAVPRLEQPTDYECGNTSLAAVARSFGRDVSVAEVGRLARTRMTGTDHDNLVAAARALGATQLVAKANGSLDELAAWLAAGVPPIVGWWSREPGDPPWRRRSLRRRRKLDCGHYSVVVAVTPDEVVLMDPQEEPRERFTREAWKDVWWDTDGDRYTRVDRWFLAARLG